MSTTTDNTDRKGDTLAETLPNELLTKKELAQRLRISPRKIEMDENLPKIQWGRNVRYDWIEVMTYLKGSQS